MIHTRVVYSKASMLLNVEVCCVVSLVLTPWKSQKPSSDVLSFFCTLHDLTVNKGDSSPKSILILFFFSGVQIENFHLSNFIGFVCHSGCFHNRSKWKAQRKKVLLQMTLTFDVRKHPSKEIHPQMLIKEKMCQSTSPIHFKNKHYICICIICCVLHHSSNPDIML